MDPVVEPASPKLAISGREGESPLATPALTPANTSGHTSSRRQELSPGQAAIAAAMAQIAREELEALQKAAVSPAPSLTIRVSPQDSLATQTGGVPSASDPGAPSGSQGQGWWHDPNQRAAASQRLGRSITPTGTRGRGVGRGGSSMSTRDTSGHPASVALRRASVGAGPPPSPATPPRTPAHSDAGLRRGKPPALPTFKEVTTFPPACTPAQYEAWEMAVSDILRIWQAHNEFPLSDRMQVDLVMSLAMHPDVRNTLKREEELAQSFSSDLKELFSRARRRYIAIDQDKKDRAALAAYEQGDKDFLAYAAEFDTRALRVTDLTGPETMARFFEGLRPELQAEVNRHFAQKRWVEYDLQEVRQYLTMVAHTIPRPPSSKGVAANALSASSDSEWVDELGVSLPTVMVNEMGAERVRCFHCNREGHFKRACPDLAAGRPPRPYQGTQEPAFGPRPSIPGRGRGSAGGRGAILRQASQQPGNFRQPRAPQSALQRAIQALNELALAQGEGSPIQEDALAPKEKAAPSNVAFDLGLEGEQTEEGEA